MPRLVLAGGLHRLSFCPGMDRGYIRGSVLLRLPYGVIPCAEVLQERIWAAVLEGADSIGLILTVIAATFVVLQLPIQLLFQGRRAATCLRICLNRPPGRLILDVMHVLNTGFNWHGHTSVWTHQRSWAICKGRRQVKAMTLLFQNSGIILLRTALRANKKQDSLQKLKLMGGSILTSNLKPVSFTIFMFLYCLFCWLVCWICCLHIPQLMWLTFYAFRTLNVMCGQSSVYSISRPSRLPTMLTCQKTFMGHW